MTELKLNIDQTPAVKKMIIEEGQFKYCARLTVAGIALTSAWYYGNQNDCDDFKNKILQGIEHGFLEVLK